MSELGDFLSDRRKLKELTQMEVASEIGVSRTTIQNWEEGKCIPNRKYRSKMLQVFDVPRETFLRMVDIGEQKEEKEINNWPGFLFGEWDADSLEEELVQAMFSDGIYDDWAYIEETNRKKLLYWNQRVFLKS